MYKIYECIGTNATITYLEDIGYPYIAYATPLCEIMLFDYKKCLIEKIVTHKYLKNDISIFAFSQNGEFFAFANKNYLFIMSLQNLEIINKIDIKDINPATINFIATSNYLIIGCNDGKILLYNILYNIPLSLLYSFTATGKQNATVSAFASYKNFIACASYNGSIVIIDIYTKAIKEIASKGNMPINVLYFADEESIVCARDGSKIEIIHIKNGDIFQIDTLISSIKNIIKVPDTNYIALSGDSNIITVIDVRKHKIIYSKFIELEAKIDKLIMPENEVLIAALENKKIVKIELQHIKKLSNLLLHNSLKEAYSLIDKEPFLNNSLPYIAFEEKFAKSYSASIALLIEKNVPLAAQLLDAYVEIPSKYLKIKELFSSFEKYERFQELVLEKKYALAYAMSTKHTPLKETHEYKQMEEHFRAAFSKAAKYILKSDFINAKEELLAYLGTSSKKPLINLLLTNHKTFLELLKALKESDFVAIEKLSKKNKVLLELPSIPLLQKLNYQEIAFNKDFIKIQKGNMHLKEAYDNDNFKECYELLDGFVHLKEQELGRILENYWCKLMQKCEVYALKGEFKKVKKELGELIFIKSRREKIGDLLKLSFYSKIDILISANDLFGAETIIYSYLDIFGIDSQISQIMKKYETTSKEKLAINHNSIKKDDWIDSPIIKMYS